VKPRNNQSFHKFSESASKRCGSFDSPHLQSYLFRRQQTGRNGCTFGRHQKRPAEPLVPLPSCFEQPLHPFCTFGRHLHRYRKITAISLRNRSPVFTYDRISRSIRHKPAPVFVMRPPIRSQQVCAILANRLFYSRDRQHSPFKGAMRPTSPRRSFSNPVKSSGFPDAYCLLLGLLVVNIATTFAEACGSKEAANKTRTADTKRPFFPRPYHEKVAAIKTLRVDRVISSAVAVQRILSHTERTPGAADTDWGRRRMTPRLGDVCNGRDTFHGWWTLGF
jgi:hypothetical protein